MENGTMKTKTLSPELLHRIGETALRRDPEHCPYDLNLAEIGESVPGPVHSASLNERFRSRGEDDFVDKLLPALHYLFDGHEEKATSKKDGA
jgi:hypothetical protein